MFAEQLFKEIETKKAAGGIEFEVKLSMLEIYNEVSLQCLNWFVKFIRILILTKKYDDSTESLMWWKGGKWSSCHHRSWKEETTVEDSTGSEKRILRWVAYLQTFFMAYLQKFMTLFHFFSGRPERGAREQLWWNQRPHGRGDGNSKF